MCEGLGVLQSSIASPPIPPEGLGGTPVEAQDVAEAQPKVTATVRDHTGDTSSSAIEDLTAPDDQIVLQSMPRCHSVGTGLSGLCPVA